MQEEPASWRALYVVSDFFTKVLGKKSSRISNLLIRKQLSDTVQILLHFSWANCLMLLE